MLHLNQDGRLVDLPLSNPMLKWMCGKELTIADIAEILPAQAQFLNALQVRCEGNRDMWSEKCSRNRMVVWLFN